MRGVMLSLLCCVKCALVCDDVLTLLLPSMEHAKPRTSVGMACLCSTAFPCLAQGLAPRRHGTR